MTKWAPRTDCGQPKIIPTRGPHRVFYPTDTRLIQLVSFGLLEYTPDYGPHANVYRPVHPADAEVVEAWLDGNYLKRL